MGQETDSKGELSFAAAEIESTLQAAVPAPGDSLTSKVGVIAEEDQFTAPAATHKEADGQETDVSRP